MALVATDRANIVGEGETGSSCVSSQGLSFLFCTLRGLDFVAHGDRLLM